MLIVGEHRNHSRCRTAGMRGWEKLATALETIKKMTFRQPAQKKKSRPLFPVHLHALVRRVLPIGIEKAES